MQGYCDAYKWTILKGTSPEVKCLHPTSSRREMCTSSVSNVIYHKFSHGAAFYTLSGKNANVMLEFLLACRNVTGNVIAILSQASGLLLEFAGIVWVIIFCGGESVDGRGERMCCCGRTGPAG